MFLSGAPPSVGAERTTKFSALQTPRWPETALLECSKQEYVQSPFRRLIRRFGYEAKKIVGQKIVGHRKKGGACAGCAPFWIRA